MIIRVKGLYPAFSYPRWVRYMVNSIYSKSECFSFYQNYDYLDSNGFHFDEISNKMILQVRISYKC